ncbi:MAG TPA: hypothetical protein VK790_09030 [Solirubrobacteraceae bacterium]|nr:hypothetical protein [Solirubrobacteraceae bacterium]
MDVLAIAVVGTLCLWFPMTAIVQLPWERCRRVRRWDPVGHLLPGWSFFAPKPVRADFAVWYRWWGSYEDGRADVPQDDSSPWVELAGIEQRRVTDALVNPGRYTRKSIFTCCYGIVVTERKAAGGQSAASGRPSAEVMTSLPYVLLAEKVSTLCGDAVAVQFRIDVIHYDRGVAREVTVFTSAVHRTAAAGPAPAALSSFDSGKADRARVAAP